eukprot:9690241-Alexandrium_andersonii.AAC.1
MAGQEWSPDCWPRGVARLLAERGRQTTGQERWSPDYWPREVARMALQKVRSFGHSDFVKSPDKQTWHKLNAATAQTPPPKSPTSPASTSTPSPSPTSCCKQLQANSKIFRQLQAVPSSFKQFRASPSSLEQYQ